MFGPEQALELIQLVLTAHTHPGIIFTVFTTGGAFNPQPKFELRRIRPVLVSPITENSSGANRGYEKEKEERREKRKEKRRKRNL